MFLHSIGSPCFPVIPPCCSNVKAFQSHLLSDRGMHCKYTQLACEKMPKRPSRFRRLQHYNDKRGTHPSRGVRWPSEENKRDEERKVRREAKGPFEGGLTFLCSYMFLISPASPASTRRVWDLAGTKQASQALLAMKG